MRDETLLSWRKPPFGGLIALIRVGVNLGCERSGLSMSLFWGRGKPLAVGRSGLSLLSRLGGQKGFQGKG